MKFIRTHLILLVFAAMARGVPAQGEVYLTPEAFLAESFAGKAPPPRIVWLTGALAEQARALLGRPPSVLRMRYWADQDRSAWILSETGKTEPITAGIVIEGHKIAQVRILEFRESRGGEVRFPFFTHQFNGLSLAEKDRLSGPVDGISGATLSVRAVERMARLALLLDRHASASQAAAP